MNRLTEAWFEFAGMRSDAMHVRLLAMPRRHMPAQRGERVVVPGRSGYLWMPDGDAYDEIAITAQCATEDGYSPEAIAAWLAGDGELRFSDEPERVYRGRICTPMGRESMFLRFDAQKFSVEWICQPYRYKHLAAADADDIAISTSGTTITNPGTCEALPLITVRGSGDITLTVGGSYLEIAGLTDGIVIDSETMDCFDLTQTALMNGSVTMDEFPRLRIGPNAIAWTGSVTSVVVRPRWRWL